MKVDRQSTISMVIFNSYVSIPEGSIQITIVTTRKTPMACETTLFDQGSVGLTVRCDCWCFRQANGGKRCIQIMLGYGRNVERANLSKLRHSGIWEDCCNAIWWLFVDEDSRQIFLYLIVLLQTFHSFFVFFSNGLQIQQAICRVAT